MSTEKQLKLRSQPYATLESMGVYAMGKKYCDKHSLADTTVGLFVMQVCLAALVYLGWQMAHSDIPVAWFGWVVFAVCLLAAPGCVVTFGQAILVAWRDRQNKGGAAPSIAEKGEEG